MERGVADDDAERGAGDEAADAVDGFVGGGGKAADVLGGQRGLHDDADGRRGGGGEGGRATETAQSEAEEAVGEEDGREGKGLLEDDGEERRSRGGEEDQ